MNLNRLYAILALALLGYGAYAAYEWTQGDEGKVVKSTAKRSGSPVSKLTTETGKPRAAKALNLSRKDDVGTEVEDRRRARREIRHLARRRQESGRRHVRR